MATRGASLGVALGAALSAAIGAGCGTSGGISDAVYTRARPDADWESYATFAIVTADDLPDLPDPPPVPDTPPDEIVYGLELTQAAVRTEMGLLGFTEVGVDENPDLYVLDFAATQNEEGIYWECVPGWYWWGFYWYWDPCAWLRPIPIQYTVGSVMVLLVDPDISPSSDFGRIVFGGLLQGVADGTGNAEQRIQSGVARMFDDYPIQP